MQAVSIVSEHEVGGAFAGDVFFFSFLFAIRTTVVRGVCVSGGKRTLGGYSGVALEQLANLPVLLGVRKARPGLSLQRYTQCRPEWNVFLLRARFFCRTRVKTPNTVSMTVTQRNGAYTYAEH